MDGISGGVGNESDMAVGQTKIIDLDRRFYKVSGKEVTEAGQNCQWESYEFS